MPVETKFETIEYASKLVEKEGHSFQDFKTRALGLQLIILGLAEVHAQRISLLSKAAIDLEDKVFSEQHLRSLAPEQYVGMYKLCNESLSRSTDFVKSTLSTVSWDKIEAELVRLKALEESSSMASAGGTADLAATAEQLIKSLAELKKRTESPPTEQSDGSDKKQSETDPEPTE